MNPGAQAGTAGTAGRKGTAAAGGPSLHQVIAEAAADAAREALRLHCAKPGNSGPYVMARALWLAMGMLLGEQSARDFIVFLAARFIDDFEAERKGVM